MAPAPISGTQGYAADAERLIDLYENISFAELHADVAHLFPAAPADILDIGAGTGRDAASMIRSWRRGCLTASLQ